MKNDKAYTGNRFETLSHSTESTKGNNYHSLAPFRYAAPTAESGHTSAANKQD